MSSAAALASWPGGCWSWWAAAGARAGESSGRLIPRWTGEASSTLPRREEEAQGSSYAAAGGRPRTAGAGFEGGCRRATRGRGTRAQKRAAAAAAGGGMALMMCDVLRRLKSWSLTKVTAGGAVATRFAFDLTKGSRAGARGGGGGERDYKGARGRWRGRGQQAAQYLRLCGRRR